MLRRLGMLVPLLGVAAAVHATGEGAIPPPRRDRQGWAPWPASALIGWLRWAFGAWAQDGYWRSRPKRTPAADAPKPGALCG